MDCGSLVSEYYDLVTLGGRIPKQIVLLSLFCLSVVAGWEGWRRTRMFPGVIVLGGAPFLLFLIALVC